MPMQEFGGLHMIWGSVTVGFYCNIISAVQFYVPQEAPCATPLLAACNENRVDVAGFLIAKGANIYYQNTVIIKIFCCCM